MNASAFIGTSGWNYKHWANGVFYPPGLKQADWLAYYCRFFDTVEINNTFYRLPSREVFESWKDGTPPGFNFAIKASRFYTHMKRLLNPEVSVSAFLENANGLGEKLGVILFQLPGRWGFQADRLRNMLEYIHSQTILPGFRAALEIRDESWYVPECFDLLKEYDVALVMADQPGFAALGPVTASFVYLRRHGPGALYASNYPEEALQADANRMRAFNDQGRDVYLYFNNDAGGFAVRNALRVKEILGIS